ncbi:MAG: amidohydrolase family protein, partial [Pelosinus sp.]|nr:amidohydrolase family protein [Pelosinus sp.]
GAKALALEKTIGEIKAGFRADIVLWDMVSPHWCPRHDTLSLLTYAANAGDVHTVIVNGKILLDNKKLTTIDEERLLYEANKRSFKLVK